MRIFQLRLLQRSPNLNAFVERFQGNCLHEHPCVAFRARYYTSAHDVDANFRPWLRHYNFERPHRGYRTQGRRLVKLFALRVWTCSGRRDGTPMRSRPRKPSTANGITTP